MSSPDFDAPPRDDIHPSEEEVRRSPVSPAPHPDEFDGPDDLQIDEEQIKRSRVPMAEWPTLDAEAPDYAHLEPAGREPLPGAKRFTLRAADIELLFKANGFDPKGPDNRIVFGFRGAVLVDDGDGTNTGVMAGVDAITLEDTRPDHRNFRCTIGYLDRATGKISAFRASTVPNVQYLSNYYMWNNGLGGNSSTGANMLPTGCYVYRMGAHGGGRIYPALRLTNPDRLAEDGQACVLRTKNDLTFKTDDVLDHCTPYDNIHCAYDFDTFSSAGCQTIQGPNGEGPWGQFQSMLRTMKVNTRIDYVLLTGRDAALAAWLRETGKAGEAEIVAKWLGRLRPGSRGEAVSRLQQQLGIKPSGYFGPVTKKRLGDLQRSKGLLADGIWSPRAEDKLGWSVFVAPSAPAAPPSPVSPAAVAPPKPVAAAAAGAGAATPAASSVPTIPAPTAVPVVAVKPVVAATPAGAAQTATAVAATAPAAPSKPEAVAAPVAPSPGAPSSAPATSAVETKPAAAAVPSVPAAASAAAPASAAPAKPEAVAVPVPPSAAVSAPSATPVAEAKPAAAAAPTVSATPAAPAKPAPAPPLTAPAPTSGVPASPAPKPPGEAASGAPTAAPKPAPAAAVPVVPVAAAIATAAASSNTAAPASEPLKSSVPKPSEVPGGSSEKSVKLGAGQTASPEAPGLVDNAPARSTGAARPNAGTMVAAPATVGSGKLILDAERLARFASNALPQYRDALIVGNETLTRYGINQSPLRLCHFLAQIATESGGLSILEENLSYRSAQRLRAVWPTRFPTSASAEPYVNNPQKLAEKVYGDRFDNRPGDGWRYRGRGLVQLTGRAHYREMGAKLGIDLENQPELASDPRHVLAIACETWAGRSLPGEHDMNRLADANKLEAITYRLLGWHVDIEDRRDAFEDAWRIWGAGEPPRRVLDMDTLERGDRGGRVPELNARLVELDLVEGGSGLRPSIIYNRATSSAVRRLQEEAGVAETGAVTPDTWTVLERALEAKADGRWAPSRARRVGVAPVRSPIARRMNEIRAWSVALSLLAVVFVATYIYALTHSTGNTPLWMPLVFAGMVFVTGLAMLLAAQMKSQVEAEDRSGQGQSGGSRGGGAIGVETQGFLPGEAEPIRVCVNI